MSAIITLYDIPSTKGIWSPNTIKTRYALNYKGIPFQTVWVEYPDIATLYDKHKLVAKDKRDDGSDYHTLPVIVDPSTDTVLSDSFDIAVYLEKAYPGTPRLFPHNTTALTQGFQRGFEARFSPLGGIARGSTIHILNPRSAEFYRKDREKTAGIALEELSPVGPVRDGHLAKGEKEFEIVKSWLDHETGDWVMGETFSYADMVVSAWFLFFRVFAGEESAEWKTVEGWHGGRWGKLVKAMDKYAVV